jgi:hypothetical protein
VSRKASARRSLATKLIAGLGVVAGLAGIGSFLIDLVPILPTPVEANAIVGCWSMYGNRVRAEADNSLSGGLLDPTWRYLGGASYQVEWPPVTDIVQLSLDGRSFSGANIFGAAIVGQRASGVPGATGFAGSWKYNNQDFWADSDGNVGLGTLTGTWSSRPENTIQIDWTHNVVADYTLSADGQRLDGQDNFGQMVSATRIPC